jgi:hypothetical protein
MDQYSHNTNKCKENGMEESSKEQLEQLASFTPEELIMIIETHTLMRGALVRMVKVANRMASRPENHSVIFALDADADEYALSLSSVHNSETNEMGLELIIEKCGVKH